MMLMGILSDTRNTTYNMTNPDREAYSVLYGFRQRQHVAVPDRRFTDEIAERLEKLAAEFIWMDTARLF